MTVREALDRVLQQDTLNFVLTNRLPRRLLTRLADGFCRIEQPLVRDLSLRIWTLCAGDLRLHEARKKTFASVHDCFVRELAPGARPIDATPGVLVSPCDAIVGTAGRVADGELLQIKGSRYPLDALVQDRRLAERYHDGTYVTLRLTSAMYHRFHAPADCELVDVRYIAGDFWNVNPIALARVPRLFCRNERVVLDLRRRPSGEPLTLVAVAAILVGGICLRGVDRPLDSRYDGPSRVACRATFGRGDEIGHFQHGSTIVVLGPGALTLAPAVREGAVVRVGEPLLVDGQYRRDA